MAFTLITDRNEIQVCQSRLKKELKQRGQRFTCLFKAPGFPGGMRDAYCVKEFNVYWRPRGPDVQDLYKNFFGQGKPTKEYEDAIQLNTPLEGVNRKRQGGFLKSGGSRCLLHRGSLGGRLKGQNLCKYFSDLVRDFDDEGKQSKGVLVPFLDALGHFEEDYFRTIKRIVDDLTKRRNE